MQKAMDCGCVVVFEKGKEPFIIYCPEHAGKDTSPRASEIIKLIEDVDDVVGKIKEDVSLLMRSGVEVTEFLKRIKGKSSEKDNEENSDEK